MITEPNLLRCDEDALGTDKKRYACDPHGGCVHPYPISMAQSFPKPHQQPDTCHPNKEIKSRKMMGFSHRVIQHKKMNRKSWRDSGPGVREELGRTRAREKPGHREEPPLRVSWPVGHPVTAECLWGQR